MSQIHFPGGVEVRPAERRVLMQGVPVQLGARAFDLLVALIEHRDRVLSKADLMTRVWPGMIVEENNLTVQISALRKVLGNGAIATVAGRGYRFAWQPVAPAGAVSAATSADPGRAIVAVLAFDNLSGEPDMQFFADGVSEEIIHRLSRGATLGVISRTSSFQFRGERKADAALQLGCTHVLDGAIRRAGRNVRISAHLMEAKSRETLWSQRYDRPLDDIFGVQDEISESIARTLNQDFFRVSVRSLDPALYDLYLRSSPTSYSPNELTASVGLLEAITERAPHFVEAWGRLAYLRGFQHMYLPFAERAANAERVSREASYALSLDGKNIDALFGQCTVQPPFGAFTSLEGFLDRLRRAPGIGDGLRYLGWFLRHTGRVQEALDETIRICRMDPVDPMSINLLGLAYMAAGRSTDAVPLFEDLVNRIPGMSFPLSSLMRAQSFLQDWDAVGRLLEIAQSRQMREFQDTIPFVRAKRHPTSNNIDAWHAAFEAQVDRTGHIDAAQLVYAAHLGLVEEAYAAASKCRLGPARTAGDLMGPDGYRTALMFQVDMPELRNDERFPALCARLGLVEFWLATDKWPDCVDDVPYDFRAASADAKDAPRESAAF